MRQKESVLLILRAKEPFKPGRQTAWIVKAEQAQGRRHEEDEIPQMGSIFAKTCITPPVVAVIHSRPVPAHKLSSMSDLFIN